MEKKCCICGKEFESFGNNADPIKKGICCDLCNVNYVIPGRIFSSSRNVPISFEVVKTKKEKKLLEEKLLNRNFEETGFVSPKSVIYRNVSNDEVVLMCLV